MADYQPVSEAELEGAPPPPAAQAPATPSSGPTQGYEPVNDNALAPAAPMFQPGFRGPRGGIPNIPAAAAQRFKDSDAFNNIFQTAATRFANGFVNTFSALTVKDQQAMRDAGYGPGDFNSAGGALRWGAHVFGSTFNVLQDGFLALGPGIIEGVGGAAEQASRETGIGDPEMVGHEASGMAEAAMADVGDMHAMSMVDAARAQAKAPGVYSQAFRVDQTPGGGLVHTPMGRLPTEAEALPQAQVAADALHLPPATADLIHQIYTQTGRPPAEVLMDAKANNGGVLSDLVAGKQPEAYEPPAGSPPQVTPKTPLPTSPRLPPEPPSLLTYISRNGGVKDEGSELSNMGVQDWHKGGPFRARVIRDDGMELDQMRLRAQEAGYPVGDDVTSFLDAIHNEVQGRKVYSDADEARVAARREAMQHESTPEGDVARDLQALGERVPPDATLEDLQDRLDERLATIGARDVHEAQRIISQAAAESEGRLAGNDELSQAISEEDHHGYFGTETQSEDYRSGAGQEAQAQPSGEQVAGPGTVGPSPHAEPSTGARGLSKIGQSIEAKAVEANLTEGFKNTAGYDKITIADQAERSANLVNNDFDQARAVIRGEQPLPAGLKGVALVTAMEDYIKKNPDADLAYELANSPLVSATSGAAQELRLAAERTPDSATAKLQELQDAQVKQAGGAPEVAARKTAVRQARPEANGVFLPKEQLSIDRFLNEIKC